MVHSQWRCCSLWRGPRESSSTGRGVGGGKSLESHTGRTRSQIDVSNWRMFRSDVERDAYRLHHFLYILHRQFPIGVVVELEEDLQGWSSLPSWLCTAWRGGMVIFLETNLPTFSSIQKEKKEKKKEKKETFSSIQIDPNCSFCKLSCMFRTFYVGIFCKINLIKCLPASTWDFTQLRQNSVKCSTKNNRFWKWG